LMNAAKALVHVAWYEGFGIPPVEAMACGCPVIAADNSSLPEVLGSGNALFVPPASVEAIARAMDRFDNEPAIADELRQKGIARAAKYTWKATAEATLPVLTRWLG
jgi:glycosyltransferase involved in cell wall biosynthesis